MTTENSLKSFDDRLFAQDLAPTLIDYNTEIWEQRIRHLRQREFKPQLTPKPKTLSLNCDKLKTKKLIIEIGCGAGHHPLAIARMCPEAQVIAIEHTKTRFNQTQNLLKEQALGPLEVPRNLSYYHENAISWITHLLDDESVDCFYLLYPNPYPKSTDWSKRWIATPFWSELIKKLKIGGKIILASNILEYVRQAIFFNEKLWHLHLSQSHNIPIVCARTAFEKKYIERSESCFELHFVKK